MCMYVYERTRGISSRSRKSCVFHGDGKIIFQHYTETLLFLFYPFSGRPPPTYSKKYVPLAERSLRAGERAVCGGVKIFGTVEVEDGNRDGAKLQITTSTWYLFWLPSSTLGDGWGVYGVHNVEKDTSFLSPS